MKDIAMYLVNNPLVAIFLCLGLGGLIGKVRIGNFSLGATASTMVVALGVCLWTKQYAPIPIDTNLRTIFFAMFSFSLGFDVGPAFFRSLRSSGIKIVAMAIVYALVAAASVFLVGKLLGYDSATMTGLFAGAFTQTAAMGDNPAASTDLAYTMTYSVGVICSIVFVRYLTPALLRVDLLKETKRKAEAVAAAAPAEQDLLGIVQVRAFRVCGDSPLVSQTVETVEAAVDRLAEVELVHREHQPIETTHGTVLRAGDVLTIVGDLTALDRMDTLRLEEVSDACYFRIRQQDAQLVLTTEVDERIRQVLSARGIFIREVERRGKRRRSLTGLDLQKGDILHLHGPENAIRQAVSELGYLKDNGITTDIPFFSFALMAGLIIGSISFLVLGKKIGLGTSFGSLVVGLLCGWGYERCPRIGHVSESTRWFIRSIGLNLFIAVLGLTSQLTLEKLLRVDNLVLLGVGVALALLARIPVVYFGKYVLKLDPVELIGGLCGSGTNTPALNAVTEYTGSALYTLSYAPGYAVGNVMLILMGLLLSSL